MPKLSKTYDDYDFLLAAGVAVYRWIYLDEKWVRRGNEQDQERAAEEAADLVLLAFDQYHKPETMALTKGILRYLKQPRYLPIRDVAFRSEAEEIYNVGDHNRHKDALDFDKWATANLPER